jgi:heat shock protein HslJ
MNCRLAAFLVAAALAGCAQAPGAPQAPLLETYWRPVEIEGVPVPARPGTREPHLMLSTGGALVLTGSNRVQGFTGCNNVSGAFELDAARLRFKPLATTRMACLPANDIEGRYLSALNATASQRITGKVLELLDAEGKVRMRLEARALE